MPVNKTEYNRILLSYVACQACQVQIYRICTHTNIKTVHFGTEFLSSIGSKQAKKWIACTPPSFLSSALPVWQHLRGPPLLLEAAVPDEGVDGAEVQAVVGGQEPAGGEADGGAATADHHPRGGCRSGKWLRSINMEMSSRGA